jgi:hypothetical protein
MAASSRWLARHTGFWRVQPIARKMRPIWRSWYTTPNDLGHSGMRPHLAAKTKGFSPFGEEDR